MELYGTIREKPCPKCGKQIILGITGCELLPECFECHGGYPKYPEPTHHESEMSYDDLDALEDRCMGDWC